MNKVAIIGEHPEYIKDPEHVKRGLSKTVDLINYQYSEIVVNVCGDIGVGLWTTESCITNNVKYHMFLPCPPDKFSINWYDEQKDTLLKLFTKAWAVSIYSQDFSDLIEFEMYKQMINSSDFLVCFWSNRHQGITYNAMKYALDNNKIVLNHDLQLMTKKDLIKLRDIV